MADLSSYPIANSLTILSQAFNVYDVPGDGNCLFHSISLSLHGNFRHSFDYRRRICEFVSKNWAQCSGKKGFTLSWPDNDATTLSLH